MDLSKDFYFSYSYDTTQTLQQHCLSRVPGANADANATAGGGSGNGNDGGMRDPTPHRCRQAFHWNSFQMSEFATALGPALAAPWTLPLIHGSFHQQRFSVYGKPVDLVLVARRSSHYAGTRFLKVM